MHDESSPEERRGLLKNILRGALALVALPFPYVSFKYLKPQTSRRKMQALELGSAELLPPGKYRRIKYGERPVGVMRRQDGKLRAFDLRCTHAGCVVNWDNRNTFQCPCHGGAFDANGQVTSLPPERPLTRLEIVEADGKIVLHDVEIDPAAGDV